MFDSPISFGYLDGISEPRVVAPGEDSGRNENDIDPGIILCRQAGDQVSEADRAAWTRCGSFLAFRRLEQLVPEFDDFLERNANRLAPQLPPEFRNRAADYLGARLVGRWKNG